MIDDALRWIVARIWRRRFARRESDRAKWEAEGDRVRRAKPDQSVRWSKRERALLYHFECEKPTSMLIAHVFEGIKMGDLYSYTGREKQPGDDHTFAKELEARGYDLTTLKFSIRKKEKDPHA